VVGRGQLRVCGVMSEAGTKSLSNFGRYQLLLEMARGGMATLYLARLRGPESFEKLIVVKRIHDHYSTEESFTQMFLDEARITALIQHPNVATVFDMGRQDGAYYIAMEYVHGQNLQDVLRSAARMPGALHWSVVARIVADSAAGLHAAHELKGADGTPLQVVHRDVSPQNILVSYDGNVKVVDFGIAYAAERLTTTAAGTVKGKAAYMSPEQVDGKHVDRRSDIFALGTVLWEGICLRRLFRSDTDAATLLRVRDAVVPPPRDVDSTLPEGLEQVVLKALKKDPEERYQTAAELEEALNQLLVSEGQYVGRGQIQTTLDLFFHDRKKVKDEQIQRAMANEYSVPAMAVGMGGEPPSSTSLRASAAIEASHAMGLSRRGYITVGLSVAGIVALLLVLLLRSGSTPESGGAEVSAAMASAPRPAASMVEPMGRESARVIVHGAPMHRNARLVTLRLSVRPASARPMVRFRGRTHRGAEFSVIVPASNKEDLLEVTAPGYHKRTVLLTLSQDVSTVVKLTPVTASRRRAVVRWRPMRRRSPMRRPPPRRRPGIMFLDL